MSRFAGGSGVYMQPCIVGRQAVDVGGHKSICWIGNSINAGQCSVAVSTKCAMPVQQAWALVRTNQRAGAKHVCTPIPMHVNHNKHILLTIAFKFLTSSCISGSSMVALQTWLKRWEGKLLIDCEF